MATPNIVPRANGEGSLGTTAKGWGGLYITDTTTSSANTGGALQLAANDGAVMGDSHRLGVIYFKGAENTSGTLTTGARIEALTEAAWTNAENGGALYFYTTDDNASEGLALKIDSNQTTSFSGAIVATKPSVTNLGDNGSVPITAAFANIDANGGARTGIRFAGAGTAGQILVVNNTGGEALTFHNTEGTALLRGIAAAHDTMEAGFMGIFVSDGTYWNIIAGGVDTQPDVGLTAS